MTRPFLALSWGAEAAGSQAAGRAARQGYAVTLLWLFEGKACVARVLRGTDLDVWLHAGQRLEVLVVVCHPVYHLVAQLTKLQGQEGRAGAAGVCVDSAAAQVLGDAVRARMLCFAYLLSAHRVMVVL